MGGLVGTRAAPRQRGAGAVTQATLDLQPPGGDGETPPGARWATAADRRDAARATYRRSVAQGAPLSGAELGRRYGRSPQWGR
jgi:hypothetical protein